MENQVIMYDWLVALVGYILGDQIFIIGSLVVSCESFYFSKDKYFKNKTQHNLGLIHVVKWNVVMTGSYINKCAIVNTIHSDSVLIFQQNCDWFRNKFLFWKDVCTAIILIFCSFTPVLYIFT